jgi:AraC-like DNA-binding protein
VARLPVLAFEPKRSGKLRLEVLPLTVFEQPSAQGLHGHKFFEMIYVRSGSGVHRLGPKEEAARPGDLFLIAPGDVHDPAGLRGAEGRLVLFSADALDPSRTDAEAFALPGELTLLSFLRGTSGGAGRLSLPKARRAAFEARLDELSRELLEDRLGSTEAARALLQLLLVEVARLSADALNAIAPAARPLLSQAFRFIEQRYARPISLADVARAVGRTPAHLTSLVRRETGRTVLAWITERRMAEARRRLLETEDDVADVAEAVGYSDVSYFIRLFRRLHGETPRGFRLGRGWTNVSPARALRVNL